MKKYYYSIGEVAQMYNVNTSLIRYWEKQFKQIKPKKGSDGKRKFTQKDIKIFDEIYSLIKLKGFTLQGAKMKLNNDNNSELINIEIEKKPINIEELKEKILTIRSKLVDLI